MNCDIRKLDESSRCFLPHAHQPFDVIGRFIPMYDGETWSYREVLDDTHRQKKYRDDRIAPKDYIENKERAIFLAVCDDMCVGLVRMRVNWFGVGYIEDLAVDAQYRHMGIGQKLMDSAVDWCRELQIDRITLETQDNNVQACRFYIRYGFVICGIDTQKYSFLEECRDEIAIYFSLAISKMIELGI